MFRTLGRKRFFLQQFVDDVVKCHLKRQGVQSRLYTYNDGWDYVQGYSPRLLESVVLGSGEKEHMLEDMMQFQSNGTSAWEFPTIVAICFTGRPEQGRPLWFPHWRRTSAYRSTSSIWQISTIAV
jgi:hypothetical protein